MTIAAFAFVHHVEMGSWLFNEYLPQAIEAKGLTCAKGAGCRWWDWSSTEGFGYCHGGG